MSAEIRDRDLFDGWATEFGWSIDPFTLFNGRAMTSYRRGVREIQVWINTFGDLERVDLAENGWPIEPLPLDADPARVLAWMRAAS